jgi:hypothetical protein
LGHSEASAPLPQDPEATGPASSDPPTSSSSTESIRRQTHFENEDVDTLTSELHTVALSDQHLSEYLEHFDWEEIGEYGDEDTIDMWSSILDTLNTTTGTTSSTTGTTSSTAGTTSDADDSGVNAESNANDGDS